MKASILLFGAALLCSSFLRAGTICAGADTLELGCIYTNFGPQETYQTDGGGLTPGYSEIGVAFTPYSSHLLQNIEVAVYRANAEIPDAVTFSIYGTTAGFPGDLLESFALTSLGVFGGEPGPATITAASVLHPLLEGGMRYWLVMGGINPGDVTWNFNSTGQFGAATLVAPGQDEQSAHWDSLPNHLQGAFAVDGSPVPEPATFALGLGLTAVVLVRRRSRH